MRRSAAVLVFAGLVAAGCGSDVRTPVEDTGGPAAFDAGTSTPDTAGLSSAELVDQTPAPPGFDPEGANVLPTEGAWVYRRGEIASNTCGSFAVGDADTPFRIVYADGGAFVIEQGEPWGDIVCFVLGSTFVCPERGGGELPVPREDLRVTYIISAEGDVVDTDALVGTQHIDVDCEGEACALAPALLGVTFPCQWVVPFEATRVP